jgi:hypothetical protein
MKPQPIIVLDDVETASRWFQDALGLASGHGGPDYEMLMDGDDMVAQLHAWEADEHPHLGDPDDPSRAPQHEVWVRGPEGYVVVVAGPRLPGR